jgi:anti-sigma B factor antagonist
VIVVFTYGEVDVLTAGRLRAAVSKALREAGADRGRRSDRVTFLGSHGLAALADEASTAQQRRQPLRVVDETRPVIRPLQITGLDKVLSLYYSVEEALPQ